MKHVRNSSTEEVHFLYGNIRHSLCGQPLGFTSHFTDRQVNCTRCIRLIKEARKVTDAEMEEAKSAIINH